MTTVGTLFGNPDLLRRICVTFAALAAYRVGCWIPLPGIDIGTLFDRSNPGLMSASIQHVAIMSLGLTPMLSALILAEVAMIIWPRLRRGSLAAPLSERRDQWLILGTLALTTLQATGLAVAFEEVGPTLVPEPGLAFRAGVVVSLAGATACLIGLATLITRHGVGHGFWIFIAAPHVISFSQSLVVQGLIWGPASPVTIALSVGLLAVAAAAFATVARASPPVSDTSELLWAPIVGLAATIWVVGLFWLAGWLLLPANVTPAVGATTMKGQLWLMAPAITAFAVLLRRRGFRPAQERRSVASAVPVILALAVPMLAANYLAHIAAQPLFPTAASVLILAGVGLSLVNAFIPKNEPFADDN